MTMSVAGPKADGDAVSRASGQRPRHVLRRIAWTLIALVFAFGALLAAGFAWFIERVPAEEINLTRRADGIVALTGGASRVNDAIDLLAKGHGKRLLISGLNRTTTLAEIARLHPDFASVVRCCVDIDRSVNTLGNAIQTKRWAEAKGFASLIVVTSNYHMPRALAELRHQMHDAVLVPFPVVPERPKGEGSEIKGAPTRLIVLEYLKFVYAKLRMGLNPNAAPPPEAGQPG
jgi:uncharacterized SAM-binding protein YcdF (DUF218 family)